jgi:hypothetical protein
MDAIRSRRGPALFLLFSAGVHAAAVRKLAACRGSMADERAALLRERTQLATAIRHLVDAVKLGRATDTLLAELATQEAALKGLERRIADIDGSRVVVATDGARLTARVAAAAREFRAMLKDGGPRARRVLQRVLDDRRVPCEPLRDPGRHGYRFREEKVPYAGLFTDLGGPNGIRTRVSALRGPCPGPLDDGAG